MSVATSPQALVLSWLARLPLLDAAALALLGDLNIVATERTLDELREGGWLLRLPTASGLASGESWLGGPDSPRYALSPVALAALRADPERARTMLGPFSPWQASLLSLGAAIASAPVTLTLNGVLAQLAAAIRSADAGELVYATQQPLPRRRRDGVADPSRLPLRIGHAEARWRSGARETRFALHVVRPGVPASFRSTLFSSWRTLHAQGLKERDAALLVICSSWGELRAWERVWHRQASRYGRSRLPRVALGLARDVLAPYHLDDPVWFLPSSVTANHRLLGALSWLPAAGPEPELRHGSLRRVGPRGSSLAAFASEARRSTEPLLAISVASLAFGPEEWRLLAMLAAQPWLRADEIAEIQQVGGTAMKRRLRSLAQAGVIRPHPDPSSDVRWAVDYHGALLVAARAGALPRSRSFARLLGLPRSPLEAAEQAPSAHTAGVSRCSVLFSAAARRAGLQPHAWLDERHWRHSISAAAPVPDGALIIRDPVTDGRVAVILEYERVQRGGSYGTDKVEAWRQWFEAERWRGHFRCCPLLLIVAGRDSAVRREQMLWRAVAAAPASLPLLGAPESTLAREGFGGAWHAAGGGTSSPAALLAPALAA